MNVLHYIVEAMAEILKLGLGLLLWLILLIAMWNFFGGTRRHLWTTYISDYYHSTSGPVITPREKFILVMWMFVRPDKINTIHKNLSLGMNCKSSIYKVMYPDRYKEDMV